MFHNQHIVLVWFCSSAPKRRSLDTGIDVSAVSALDQHHASSTDNGLGSTVSVESVHVIIRCMDGCSFRNAVIALIIERDHTGSVCCY